MRQCKECRYWLRVTENQRQSECRRYPPLIVGFLVPTGQDLTIAGNRAVGMEVRVSTNYPITRDEWGCGEGKEVEQ